MNLTCTYDLAMIFFFCDLIFVGFWNVVWEQKRWIHYFLLSYGTLPFPPLAVFHQILISKIDCFLIFGTDETICSQSISLIDGNLNSFIVCILFVPSPAGIVSAIQYKYLIPLLVHIHIPFHISASLYWYQEFHKKCINGIFCVKILFFLQTPTLS